MAVDPYELDPEFERAVAMLCATKPKFFGAIAHALQLEAIEQPPARLVVEAAIAIAKDNGHGPTAPLMIFQRLHRWRADGRVSQDQIDDAIDMFLDAPELPPVNDVMKELVPVLKRRMEADVVRVAMDDYKRRGDFGLVQKIINQVGRLGTHDDTLGTRLGMSSFDEIARIRHLDKIPLGIDELDLGLGGGLPRGCLCVYVGGPGAGKSMFLSHTAAYAMTAGLFVLYATLELSEAVVLARVKACLTGQTIDSIITGDDLQARALIKELYPVLGTFIVKDFPAKATTMLDIREWVKECEEDEGYEADVIVIDYGDKLKSHNRDDKNEYAGQGTVYEDMRLFMKDTGKWGFTASQAKGKAGREKRRRLEIDDLADSMNKGRVADLTVTINPHEEELEYFVAKNRNGKSNFSVGPLPHDWSVGSMVAGARPGDRP